ncbi:MAG: purine-nucleoside phosphorylase [Deltaproteobacteria bacterium]|nr:purine-nucleoside phosphorylase [Deltaproteobacteria bacterium]
MEDFKNQVREAAAHIGRGLDTQPEIGIILGTGLGGIAEALDETSDFLYETIPYFPVSTVVSHRGRLLCGNLSGKRIIAMQGRFHLYEGYSARQIAFPIRVMRELGVRLLILSNAAGGLNPLFRAGDLMLITDHINLTGHNPLLGPNVDEWGPRFPEMVEPYSRRLQEMAVRTALAEGILLHRGVFAGVLGPNLETAAETRFLRAIGADAVGMSTVTEVITAVHAGIEVLAISAVTNVNLPDCYQPASVEEIIATAESTGPKLVHLFRRILEAI